MILAFLKVLALGLQALLMWVVVQHLRSPYRFRQWRKAWGWLLAALVLQTERQVYEFYWLDENLRHILVTGLTSGCMLVSLQALRTILRLDGVLVPIASPVAHIVVDQFSVILDWDRTAERLFGWSASEVIGQTLMQTLIVPRDWETHRGEMLRAQAATKPTGTVLVENYAINARHKNGGELPIEVTVTVNTLPDGTQTFLADVRRLGRL